MTASMSTSTLSVFHPFLSRIIMMSGFIFCVSALVAQQIPCENGDSFDQRCTLIAGAEGVLGNNTAAGAEPGEPFHTGVEVGKSIWWQFQADRDGWGEVLIEDGEFIPLLVVYRGNLLSELVRVASNEDSEDGSLNRQMMFRVGQGEFYELVATGHDGASGVFQFDISTRPPNDLFAHRETVEFNRTYAGDNRFATVEENEPNHNTAGPVEATGYASVWYTFIAPENINKVTFEMLQHGFGSEARPAVTVYRGADFSEHASPIADNYSGARRLFAFSVQPGDVYQIAVDGYRTWPHTVPTTYGDFEFRLRATEVIENDDYQHPSPILLNQDPIRTTAMEVTENLEGDPSIGESQSGSSLWWYWDSWDYEVDWQRVNDLFEIPSDGRSRVVVAMEPTDALHLKLFDESGDSFEISSESDLLTVEQRSLFDQLRRQWDQFAEMNDLSSNDHKEVMTTVAALTQYRQCITIRAGGIDRDTSKFDASISLFVGDIHPESDPLEFGEGNITFCTDLTPTRYFIALDSFPWVGPEAYTLSLVSAMPPLNDAFHQASIVEEDAVARGNNISATSDISDPPYSGNMAGHRSVWWEWTASQSGNVVIRTDGSTFTDELLLSVWLGIEPDDLRQVTRNFRIPEPLVGSSYPNMSTYATFTAQEGLTYSILVEGHGNASGMIELQLEWHEAPVNDDMNDALQISADDHLAGDNLGATMESEEWAHAGHYPGQTLWWKWTAPTYGFVRVDHGTSEDSIKTIVAIYSTLSSDDSVSFGDLIPLESNQRTGTTTFDDALAFIAHKHKTYFVAVNGREGSVGSVNLDFSFQPGFYLRDTHVVNGALEFDVLGELGIGPKFNLETSTDLRTWVPMGLSHELIDGQNVINDLINPENSYQFFRVVELNGD